MTNRTEKRWCYKRHWWSHPAVNADYNSKWSLCSHGGGGANNKTDSLCSVLCLEKAKLMNLENKILRTGIKEEIQVHLSVFSCKFLILSRQIHFRIVGSTLPREQSVLRGRYHYCLLLPWPVCPKDAICHYMYARVDWFFSFYFVILFPNKGR